jgi:calcium-dependent phosphoinositide phospholipase C
MLVALALGTAAWVTRPTTPTLRLNDLQLLGTHNSYHVAPSGLLFGLVARVSGEVANTDYTHPALARQLSDQRARQLELDVWADPGGSLWRPSGIRGFKVFHAPGPDMGSVCEVLVDCLRELRTWSRAHPAHLPIAVMLEPKDSKGWVGTPDPVPITTMVLDSLDAEIRSVMTPDDVITPDDVRDGAPTLERAVLERGWPSLDASRGKFVFLLSGHRAQYRVGHPSLQHRVMFTPSFAGQPDAAFVKVDDPRGPNEAKIRDLVSRGYVVRTRADSPVVTPTSGDTLQRKAAFASGAQWVSTDYPVAGVAKDIGSDYVAELPRGELARCNPVVAPKGCVRSLLSEAPRPQFRLPWELSVTR